jgi:hypothetical protein
MESIRHAIPRFLDEANRGAKLAMVILGYALAFAAGILAGMLYDQRFTPTDQQASGGMILFAETMFGAGVFAAVSTAPTALALWFVRGHREIWKPFTTACLAFALVGMVAVIALLTVQLETVRQPFFALLSVLGIAQMLGSPIWIGSFALIAWLAPQRDLRRRMLVAVMIEIVIGACALVHFHPR